MKNLMIVALFLAVVLFAAPAALQAQNCNVYGDAQAGVYGSGSSALIYAYAASFHPDYGPTGCSYYMGVGVDISIPSLGSGVWDIALGDTGLDGEDAVVEWYGEAPYWGPGYEYLLQALHYYDHFNYPFESVLFKTSSVSFYVPE